MHIIVNSELDERVTKARRVRNGCHEQSSAGWWLPIKNREGNGPHENAFQQNVFQRR
jgi:hypothetical protein